MLVTLVIVCLSILSSRVCSCANSCDSSATGCSTCTEDGGTVCTGCLTGYYLDSGECKGCRYGCTSCTSRTVCTSCKLRSSLVNNDCWPCDDYDCKDCSGNTAVCKECVPGRGLVNGKCEDCARDYTCAKCDGDAAVCTECKPGYGALTNGQCSKCVDDGCLECPVSTDQCTVGPPPTAPPGEPTRQPPSGPTRQPSGPTRQPSGPTRQPPPIPPPSPPTPECTIVGCLACEPGSTECKSCGFTRYWNSARGTCDFCPIGCLSCTSSSQCTSCADGSGLNNGKCQRCPLFCDKCGPDSSKCVQCGEGRRVTAQGTCEACEDFRCGKCPESKDLCIACKEGYQDVIQEGTCKTRCQVPGCAECPGDVNKCVKCKSYYPQCYLEEPTLPLCRSCNDPNCGKCSSDVNVCERCKPTYYDTSSCKLCRAAVANCVLCDNSGQCTRCDPSYSVINGQCQLDDI